MATVFKEKHALWTLALIGTVLSACSGQPEPYVRRTPAAESASSDGQKDQNTGNNGGGFSDETTGGANKDTPPPTPPPPSPNPPPPPPSGTAASGTTAVTFTPVRYPNAVYPAFVYAVWVTDSGGRYVKTLGARAQVRMRYLDKWIASAGVAQPDGLSGASLAYPATPAPITVNWDMKDKAGAFVPQGNYNINMQMTSANNTGVSLVVPVTINATGITKSDTSMTTGITAVNAKHTP